MHVFLLVLLVLALQVLRTFVVSPTFSTSAGVQAADGGTGPRQRVVLCRGRLRSRAKRPARALARTAFTAAWRERGHRAVLRRARGGADAAASEVRRPPEHTDCFPVAALSALEVDRCRITRQRCIPIVCHVPRATEFASKVLQVYLHGGAGFTFVKYARNKQRVCLLPSCRFWNLRLLPRERRGRWHRFLSTAEKLVLVLIAVGAVLSRPLRGNKPPTAAWTRK